MHAPLTNLSNPATPTDAVVPLPSDIFLHSCHPSLFHLLVRQHLASLRQGTAATQTRAETAYSGRKIRPQKGTGKARLGDRGSPMLKGGGRAFAKKPKDWSFHVNRKMVHKGLRASLALRWATGQLSIVDSETLPQWLKTSEAAKTLSAEPLAWTRERGTILYLGQQSLASDAGLALEQTTRNLPLFEVGDISLTSALFNVYDLLRPSRVVMDVDALEEVCQLLSPSVQAEVEEEALLVSEEMLRELQLNGMVMDGAQQQPEQQTM